MILKLPLSDRYTILNISQEEEMKPKWEILKHWQDAPPAFLDHRGWIKWTLVDWKIWLCQNVENTTEEEQTVSNQKSPSKPKRSMSDKMPLAIYIYHTSTQFFLVRKWLYNEDNL